MSDTTIDLREMFPNHEESVYRAVMGIMKSFYIALPVTVDKDTEDGNTTALKSNIKGHILKEDGSHEFVDMPIMDDAVLQFSGGAGHHFTHPVKKGDEGFVLFMSRNMDAWHQSGGTQQPVDTRLGNLSDGKFIPGTHSKPNAIPAYSKETAQVRHGDKAQSLVDVSPHGVLHRRGEGDSASKVHVVDDGVLHKKGETITAWLDDRIDKRSPKILMNCA